MSLLSLRKVATTFLNQRFYLNSGWWHAGKAFFFLWNKARGHACTEKKGISHKQKPSTHFLQVCAFAVRTIRPVCRRSIYYICTCGFPIITDGARCLLPRLFAQIGAWVFSYCHRWGQVPSASGCVFGLETVWRTSHAGPHKTQDLGNCTIALLHQVQAYTFFKGWLID